MIDTTRSGGVPDAAASTVTGGRGYRIIVDPTWGYRRIDPLPTASELGIYYESHYAALVGSPGRAPELARLLGTGDEPEAEAEREWQAATIHGDIVAALESGVSEGLPRRTLDIGCGTGELVRALCDAGWDTIGTEPSPRLASVGAGRGCHIEVATASEFLERWRSAGGQEFSAITLLNVLEHVPDPAGLVRDLLVALSPGGVLVVRVPNDFNALQLAALRHLGGEAWWVVVPDHVNYFDHGSIVTLLHQLGVEVIDRMADFPMELFLLLGYDYRGRPEIGSDVHARRRRLELALDPETRRSFGRAMYEAGLGRNVTVVARRP